jgi:hypothetical protein
MPPENNSLLTFAIVLTEDAWFISITEKRAQENRN